jgi:hypothetical protein
MQKHVFLHIVGDLSSNDNYFTQKVDAANEWKTCPTTWKGQLTRGNKGTTTVILEAVATYDLWI